MTNQQKIIFKNKLKLICYEIIQQRINGARTAIDNAQQTANSEEKSSAGDKYETSRAMSHLEKDMHARQLSENVKELATLHVINVDAVYDRGAPGAFFQCAGSSFFIAAGLGKLIVEGNPIFFISPHAPLAKILQDKKAGDRFLLKGVETNILDVY